MDKWLAYVWEHFTSLYHVPQEAGIAYLPGQEGRVKIYSYQGDFFRQREPRPDQIAWHTWENQEIPFLFGPAEKTEILTRKGNQVTINYDLVAGAFYFLSGWQEYFSQDRDRFGRFPYRSSLQSRLGIVLVPVVNYYFDILKKALEEVYQIKLYPKINPQGGFISCLTHDVDNAASGWKAEVLAAFQKGQLLQTARHLWNRVQGRDPWFNWVKVADITREAGGKSTFFFLANDQPYQGTNNADYDIRQPKYQDALRHLSEKGSEIGLHGSLKAAVSENQFAAEKSRLAVAVRGNRFHYLSYDPHQTPALLQGAGIDYDSSLGFAEQFGFRHSYCFPFRPFNFETQSAYDFWEIPLHLMDATLHHRDYLQLSPGEIIPAIAPMVQEIKKFGGVFSLLWHNENFSEAKIANGLSTFLNLMAFLKAEESLFCTGSEVWSLFASQK